MTQWFYPFGSAAQEGWTTVIDARTPGWTHTGLRTATLAGGQSRQLPAEEVERIILPLAGSFHVEVPGWSADLTGRQNVFSGPTDTVYVGPCTALELSGHGRVAVASAHATQERPPSYQPATAVPIELRGTGNMSRQVRNFGTPDALDAESIIACEVLTPAGNWSSYPAHKHDHELAGVETELEEIYYFELRTAPGVVAPPERCVPFGYHRTTSSDDRAIDVLVEVHDQDVALVPFGWHGPSMAAPGYDMYYLNVMGGPGRERAWLISDHPDQTWVRTLWPTMDVDPRLPFEHPSQA